MGDLNEKGRTAHPVHPTQPTPSNPVKEAVMPHQPTTTATDIAADLPQTCAKCGRAVMPTGIYAMPLDGYCACIFWRI